MNSFPVSDQGEPHTQEHLLVGKGTTGRAFAGLDTMWLSQSSAYTGQWRTNYVFNTSAGPEVFYKLLDAQLNALLHPDYTDEEIRREVRNFGVTENADHTGGTRRTPISATARSSSISWPRASSPATARTASS